MRQLLGIVKCSQFIQTLVRYFRHSNVGFTRVGIALIGYLGLSENSKQRGFAYLGQADDAGFHKVRELQPSARQTRHFENNPNANGVERYRPATVRYTTTRPSSKTPPSSRVDQP